MSQKRYLQIKNFDATQMYKDRSPIWIKLPCAILDDYEFSSISDETKFHAIGLMLLASRLNNKFPDDEHWLRRKINANSEINIEKLIEIGFLEVAKNEIIACKPKKTKSKFVKQSEKLCNTEQNRTEEKKTEQKRTEHNATQQTREKLDAENGGGAACADSENLFSENDADFDSREDEKPETEKVVQNGSPSNDHRSEFSIEECLRYVEKCRANGDDIKNAKGLAAHLFKTGASDAFIRHALYPEKQTEIDRKIFGEPRRFTGEPCAVCYGAKMSNPDGKGFRACAYCKNERGKSTGLEPEEKSQDSSPKTQYEEEKNDEN